MRLKFYVFLTPKFTLSFFYRVVQGSVARMGVGQLNTPVAVCTNPTPKPIEKPKCFFIGGVELETPKTGYP